MKRVLYGTTALVAAGLLVTSVSYAGDEEMMEEEMMEEEMMAAPISVGVSGYYNIAAGSISLDKDVNEDNGLTNRDHFINQNIEINIAGSTTLDNGITAGVNIWLNGNNDSGDGSNISETRVSLGGAFGTVTAGSFENAAQLGTIWAPGGNGNFGIKSPFFSGGKRVSWNAGFGAEDALKIMYASPSFNGISLSASYAPESSSDAYAKRGTGDAGHWSEVVSLSLGYSQELMGGSVSAGVGIEEGTIEGTENKDDKTATDLCTGNCDMSTIRGGLLFSIDQISIGASILEIDKQGNSTTDTDVGIGWSQGPLGLGIQYASRDADKEFEVTAFNAAYALGPGVELNSQIAMGSAGSNEWTEFLIGTTISF